jgi:uncharacterized protein YbjT (DUF2867 family)
MTSRLDVLVTGATGKQGGTVARELLARGHSVRALTRRPDSPAATMLTELGIQIIPGDFEDQASLERAARGADAVFAMTTPFETGARAEVAEGANLARAAAAAGVRHFVYSSVAGADRATGIPHFDSKYEVETEILRLGVPFTIIAPVFFMENFLGESFARGIAEGSLPMALPATRRLQQIAVSDIGRFAALIIDRREEFLGRRIEIASDELTGLTAAAVLGKSSGHRVQYATLPLDSVRQWNEDLARMFAWFDRVGYDADIVGLRTRYPEVGWHRFSEWARQHDWSGTLAGEPRGRAA